MLNCALDGTPQRRYCVIAAKTRTLDRRSGGAELFSVEPGIPSWIEETSELIWRNSKAWADTLKHSAWP